MVGTASRDPLPPSVTIAARAATPFSARSDAPCRSASSSTVSDRRCAGSRRIGARVAEPDDEQVRRGAPALGPGEGAAQGLALFGRGPGCPALGSAAASLSLGCTFLALALGGLLRHARGGWPTTTVVSGSTSVVTPAGSTRSETRTCPPMVSSLTSASMAVGMSEGSALMREGEHLLLHQPVAVVHLESPRRAP